ncbi:hypothetical protein A4G19_08890 [Pasteurellaceae bacterium Macca]|nr:hypothetical protein [Pasteurellaceae bacterium Macca]
MAGSLASKFSFEKHKLKKFIIKIRKINPNGKFFNKNDRLQRYSGRFFALRCLFLLSLHKLR